MDNQVRGRSGPCERLIDVWIEVMSSFQEICEINVDTAQAVEICEQGMVVVTTEKIALDSKVRVSFVRPDSFDIVRNKGLVKKSEVTKDNVFKVYIEFEPASWDALRSLREYFMSVS